MILWAILLGAGVLCWASWSGNLSSYARNLMRGEDSRCTSVFLSPMHCWVGRRLRTDAGAWPETIRRLSALLQSGETPHGVWCVLNRATEAERANGARSASRDTEEIARFVRHMSRATGAGLDARTALSTFEARYHRSKDMVAALSVTMSLAQRTGAQLGDVLARMAESLEDDINAADARASAISGPRATSRILASLPIVGLGLGVVFGADPWTVLFGTGWGRVCFLCGGALTVLGIMWSRRMVLVATGASQTGPRHALWMLRAPATTRSAVNWP